MTPENDVGSRSAAARTTAVRLVAGMGMLRVALLFGSAAVALVIDPVRRMADKYTQPQSPAPTGSTRSPPDRSVAARRLHDSPQRAADDAGSVCIIRANGQRSGDC